MRILENVDLPAEFADLIVKPKEVPVAAPGAELEISEMETLNDEEEADNGNSEENKSVELELEPEEEPEPEEPEPEELEPEPEPEPEPELPKMVHMANLCVVGGHAVNGVAEIHTEIVKNEVFNEFFEVNNLHVTSIDIFLP